MNFFRKHTTRLYATLTIVLGFTFYMVKPAKAEQNSNEFSNWLGTFVKKQVQSDLTDRIKELADSNEDLDEVAEKASQLIRNHADDFEIPFQSDSDDDLKVQLLASWHLDQQSGGMSSTTLLEVHKPYVLLPNDGYQVGKSSVKTHFKNAVRYSITKSIAEPELIPFSTTPHLSGVAIGAP